MPEPDETRIQPFEDAAAFGRWLEHHHATESELWVKIYKKGSVKNRSIGTRRWWKPSVGAGSTG